MKNENLVSFFCGEELAMLFPIPKKEEPKKIRGFHSS